MTTPVSLELISPELLPGEKVEWTGRPNPSVVFHKEDWFLVPFSLLWGGFAIFWLLGASGIWDSWSKSSNNTFQYFGVIWGTPFVIVGQYFIWGRFLYARWRKNRTYYVLTNRRALIARNGLRGRSSSSAYFENLSVIDRWVRRDGIGSISFGGSVTGDWQWGRSSVPRPPTFDDVDEADSVYQIVIRLQAQARTAGDTTSPRWHG